MPDFGGHSGEQCYLSTSATDVTDSGTITIERTWSSWNTIYVTSDVYVNSSETTITGNNAVWVSWCGQHRGAGTTSPTTTATDFFDAQTGSIWVNWNATGGVVVQNARETPEQIAERQRQLQQATAEHYQRRETARGKAELLLRQHLTLEQAAMLDRAGHFQVTAQSGRIYEIEQGRHQNVYRLDEQGERVEQLCALPNAAMPDADVMLAQMLYLMANEEAFRRTANKWTLTPRGRVASIAA